MKTITLTPDAPVLLESMRAIGYDAASAVADLIDNSITAKAKTVDIRFNPGPARALAIIDDGEGMTPAQLTSAMRHGSQNPNLARAESDLGRFGLGLKTASLSQCRKLTVVTRRDGIVSGMAWDLEIVRRKATWAANVLDDEDLESVPFYDEFTKHATGTLVVWEDLDRIAAGDPGTGAVLADRMREVGDHLSLVFHRYLSDSALKILVNNTPIGYVDPFLEKDGAEAGPEEVMEIDGHPIRLRAFTLPHISRLTKAQIATAGGEHGLRRQQGFYVYRNKRLLVWGTWFRLFRQEELTKLTRVRVDLPNALDQLWSLDIKKSAASPPAVIRDRLRSLVPTLVRSSREVHAWRGTVTKRKGITPIWKRVEDRTNIRYEVDLTHPVVASLREQIADDLLGDFDALLRAVADCFPVEAMYNDYANERMGMRKEGPDDAQTRERLEELARMTLDAFEGRPEERERVLANLVLLEPFAHYPQITETIRQRLA